LSESTALPLKTNLSGTLALMGDEFLPLQFVSTGQINAIIPYDMPVNATQQLLIQQTSALSLPQSMQLAVAQPAVFTQDQSGQGAGIIVAVKPDQTQFVVTPKAPASAGDALVIYCAGLGAIDPVIPAGSAAPSVPLSKTVNTTTVSIGGQPAQVLFSGLAPGFAGLDQVNAIVPSGIAAGASVPVILTVGGISSSPVTVAVQ
jgi:adhesin/invasin